MYACMKVGICAYARMSVQSVRMQIRMYIHTYKKINIYIYIYIYYILYWFIHTYKDNRTIHLHMYVSRAREDIPQFQSHYLE